MLYMKAAIFSNHVLIFLFLDPGKAPGFCLYFVLLWVLVLKWKHRVFAKDSGREEPLISETVQMERGLTSKLSTQESVVSSSNRIFKMCLHPIIELNLEAASSGIFFIYVNLLFLSLTLCVTLIQSLNLRGYQSFHHMKKFKKNLLFSILIFFKFSCYDFGSKYHADTLIYSSKLSGFFLGVCGKFIKFKQEENLAIIPPHIILPKILLATASHLRNKTGRI